VSAAVLRALHAQLRHLLEQHHAPTQAGRFAVTFLVAVWLQVRGGATITGWSDLVALLVGAGHVAYRQWRKTVPAAAVLHAVSAAAADAERAESAPPAAAAPGP